MGALRSGSDCPHRCLEVADGGTRGGNKQRLDAAADEAKRGSGG